MSIIMDMFENEEAKWEKVRALLELFANQYIDVSDKRVIDWETASVAHGAIMELIVRYERDAEAAVKNHYEEMRKNGGAWVWKLTKQAENAG